MKKTTITPSVSLLGLPAELKLEIADYQPFYDIHALRLTRRHLNHILPSLKNSRGLNDGLSGRVVVKKDSLLAAEKSVWCHDNGLLYCEGCIRFHPAKDFVSLYRSARDSKEFKTQEWQSQGERHCADCVFPASSRDQCPDNPEKDLFNCWHCWALLHILGFDEEERREDQLVYCSECNYGLMSEGESHLATPRY